MTGVIGLVVVAFVVWRLLSGGAGEGDSADPAASSPPETSTSTSGMTTGGNPTPGANAGSDLPYEPFCGSYRNYEPANLTTEQKDSAQEAANELVSALYGYTGSDADEFSSDVEEVVLDRCFYGSDTGDEAQLQEELARQGGEEVASDDQAYYVQFVLFQVTGEYTTTTSEGNSYNVMQGDAVWVSRGAGIDLQAGGETTSGGLTQGGLSQGGTTQGETTQGGVTSSPADALRGSLSGYQMQLELAQEAGGSEWQIVEGGLPSGAVTSLFGDGLNPEYDDAVERAINEILRDPSVLQDDLMESTTGAGSTSQSTVGETEEQ